MQRCRKYVDRFKVDCKHSVITSNNMHNNVRELLASVDTELVAFIEDDDWYHPQYLKRMIEKLTYSQRYMIGLDPTMYYHLWHGGYRILPHYGRASLFATIGYTDFIKKWTDDVLEDPVRPLIDKALWYNAHGHGVTTVEQLAIGIKHGIGNCEGNGHAMRKAYWIADTDMSFLRKLIGDEDADDYIKLKEELIDDR